MWKLLGTPKASASESFTDSQSGTPCHGSRIIGTPSASSARPGLQTFQRPDQEQGTVQQLCERISAFVYGKARITILLVWKNWSRTLKGKSFEKIIHSISCVVLLDAGTPRFWMSYSLGESMLPLSW